MYIDIRQGRADAKGFEDETDYTLKDFAKAANALFALNERLRRFLEDTGLLASIAPKDGRCHRG